LSGLLYRPDKGGQLQGKDKYVGRKSTGEEEPDRGEDKRRGRTMRGEQARLRVEQRKDNGEIEGKTDYKESVRE
jgi:hypothetical protein